MKYSLYALERERAESARFSSHTIARGSACPHTAGGGVNCTVHGPTARIKKRWSSSENSPEC